MTQLYASTHTCTIFLSGLVSLLSLSFHIYLRPLLGWEGLGQFILFTNKNSDGTSFKFIGTLTSCFRDGSGFIAHMYYNTQ